VEAALSIPSFSRTSPEFAGSVARTIAVARLVWPPELDLLAEGLAVSGETFARHNLRLRLKASTGQAFRISATEARSKIKGQRRPASMREVRTSLHQPKVASNIQSRDWTVCGADPWQVRPSRGIWEPP